MRSKKNIRFDNGKRIYIRDDIESQMIQNNGCTNPIRIHPIVGTNMFLSETNYSRPRTVCKRTITFR